jgi:beta-1,2-mannobiose phosphorylase / 1,2-beta-oligomannan phosphorylase
MIGVTFYSEGSVGGWPDPGCNLVGDIHVEFHAVGPRHIDLPADLAVPVAIGCGSWRTTGGEWEHAPVSRSGVAEAPAGMTCSVQRLGVVMEARPEDEQECLGVLNPAIARAADGTTYLFPRIVAAGNLSRISRAAVTFDDAGRPRGVQRLGVVLQPDEPWETNSVTAGVEDPRITFMPSLACYVMTYSAYGPLGPRIAVATSSDLVAWRRHGPVSFVYEPELHADLNLYTNKDAVFFPEPVTAPDGQPAYALLHRPTWDLSMVNPSEKGTPPPGITDDRPGIWASFAPIQPGTEGQGVVPTRFGQHRLVALPEQSWEEAKIGAGPPPIAVPGGWLLVYHGVTGHATNAWPQQDLRYVAGAMLLDRHDVTRVLWRTEHPILEPELELEIDGIVPNVVFPTGLDVRAPGWAHLYYGMADTRIGVAELSWPISDPMTSSNLL